MISPDEALTRLRDGNARFAEDRSERSDRPVPEATAFATILTCVDPRIAPEIVFDQGLGQLFVVRVAGNVAGELEVGSVEIAVELGTRLVVVMGHSDCKALARWGKTGDAIREHALEQANIVRRSLAEGSARVIAALYDVETGRATFLD